jgi:hypothetical protein
LQVIVERRVQKKSVISMDDKKVVFVFDEPSKISACCIVKDNEQLKYPNQIFNESECTSVFPNMTPCLEILNMENKKCEHHVGLSLL